MKVRLFRTEKYQEKDGTSGVTIQKERQVALKGNHFFGGAAVKAVGAGKVSFEDYCEANKIDVEKSTKEELAAAKAAHAEASKGAAGTVAYDLNEKQVEHAKRHGLKVVVA